MSSEQNSEQPPAYCRLEENPNDQSNLTYGDQYNQYPGVNQYPSPGCVQYPGNQYMYHPQHTVPGQVTTSVITQPGAIVYNRTPVTKNWMVPALLSFFFCCWPLGLMAILAASKANTAAAVGDVMEAERQSNRARTYVIVAMIIGPILTGLYVFLTFLRLK